LVAVGAHCLCLFFRLDITLPILVGLFHFFESSVFEGPGLRRNLEYLLAAFGRFFEQERGVRVRVLLLFDEERRLADRVLYSGVVNGLSNGRVLALLDLRC